MLERREAQKPQPEEVSLPQETLLEFLASVHPQDLASYTKDPTINEKRVLDALASFTTRLTRVQNILIRSKKTQPGYPLPKVAAIFETGEASALRTHADTIFPEEERVVIRMIHNRLRWTSHPPELAVSPKSQVITLSHQNLAINTVYQPLYTAPIVDDVKSSWYAYGKTTLITRFIPGVFTDASVDQTEEIVYCRIIKPVLFVPVA